MTDNKLTTYIKNNRSDLQRKALILLGVSVGFAAASGLTDKLTRPRVTNLVVINEAQPILDEISDPSSEPLEP